MSTCWLAVYRNNMCWSMNHVITFSSIESAWLKEDCDMSDRLQVIAQCDCQREWFTFTWFTWFNFFSPFLLYFCLFILQTFSSSLWLSLHNLRHLFVLFYTTMPILSVLIISSLLFSFLLFSSFLSESVAPEVEVERCQAMAPQEEMQDSFKILSHCQTTLSWADQRAAEPAYWTDWNGQLNCTYLNKEQLTELQTIFCAGLLHVYTTFVGRFTEGTDQMWVWRVT